MHYNNESQVKKITGFCASTIILQLHQLSRELWLVYVQAI